ncbi:hypothetical protein BCR33DRAFT_801161 [Rhizoclosmatium globosum]|uniref:MYND-type domain-containing protein n=1 Tax=Rhizoclosmatium globosum TaxID=329046 RepID=A0A1Y2D2X8_9FUNG|nr:hypothetical protein BCR33DRAFT_801161 [Rhizoclosmatium globosum]|eukprot:ORY53567.1 hypothetical protein BCR33DRAFT_801161 [Rhizoclosmatium globosum]
MELATPLHALPSYNQPLASTHYRINSKTSEIFPTYPWLFVAEIRSVHFHIRPRVTVVLSPEVSDETATIHFYECQNVSSFSWEKVVPGSTIAILYAQQKRFSDGSLGIRQSDLSTIQVFPAQIKMLMRYMSNLKFVMESRSCVCFKDDCKVTQKLERCSSCRTVYFCSAHRMDLWSSGHNRLCGNTTEILWMMELTFGCTAQNAFYAFDKREACEMSNLVKKGMEETPSDFNESLMERMNVWPEGDDLIVNLTLESISELDERFCKH